MCQFLVSQFLKCEIAAKAIQDANIRNLVGRALVEPQLAKELLTRPKNVESINAFLERLPKNLLVSTSLNSEEDQ